MNLTVKIPTGRYVTTIPVVVTDEGSRLFLQFPYNKPLLSEVKLMKGAKYHGFDEKNPRKIWSVDNCPRNWFQLRYLSGSAPYAPYDQELVPVTTPHPIRSHQEIMARHALTRHYCIFACEMGTGKTLAAIVTMEVSGVRDWWWVGPKSALAAVELEFEKWKPKNADGSPIRPTFMTYDGLKKTMLNWSPGKKAPQGVVFDECSKAKTPTAQRTQAAQALADGVRADWGDAGYVILMSGTPAPKSPVDWWSQCEIAQPGFLVEGDIFKLKNKLAVVKTKESLAGGAYPHLVTWRDDESKCKVCGLTEHENPEHDDPLMEDYHPYEKGVNEVARLYKRMKGLVLVQFKKDCLDLPEKQYRVITLTPTPQILRAAQFISKTEPRAAQVLTLLRELSDGFQYVKKEIGKETCAGCKGHGKIRSFIAPSAAEGSTGTDAGQSNDASVVTLPFDLEMTDSARKAAGVVDWVETIEECPHCGGTGQQPKYERLVEEVPCPKEDALKGLLEEHEDVGRLVVYAGFQGSVDRVVKTCLAEQWSVIRADGRGWIHIDHTGAKSELLTAKDMLRAFQDVTSEGSIARLAFVGQPDSAGMGITLTASPTEVFYSNSFGSEGRVQAEDRIHRPGMDLNRGATIIDIVHLPTDQYVLDNLKRKRDLELMTMGELSEAISSVMSGDSRSSDGQVEETDPVW